MLSYGLLFKLTYKKEKDELHTGDPFGITVCGLGTISSMMRRMKCSKAMKNSNKRYTKYYYCFTT